MPHLNVAPTKSNLLALSDQLAFAQDGFDLLEQKRQILVFELMSRLGRAKDIERRVEQALLPAYAALKEATLDIGTERLAQAGAAVKRTHRVTVEERSVMGLSLPALALHADGAPKTGEYDFAPAEVSPSAIDAQARFSQALPLIIELAELENSVMRLAGELRKTQRRCNSLSRIFIPEYKGTIKAISSSLEERERESFVTLKMVKERLAKE